MKFPVQKRRKWKGKKELLVGPKKLKFLAHNALWLWALPSGLEVLTLESSFLFLERYLSHILRLGWGFFLSKAFSLLFCSSRGCLFTLCCGGCLSSWGNYCISCRFVVSLGGPEFRLFPCDHLGSSLRHSLLSLWDRLQGSTDSSAVRPKTFKEATFELCVICHIYDLNFLCNYLISVHLSHQIVYSVKFVTISVFAHSLCCCKYKCIFDFSFFPQECYLHKI